jgi:lipopolysaccharide/colanic/teichoic acid biosynthesis glycosyltransferase
MGLRSYMNMIIIHKSHNPALTGNNGDALLRFALCTEPLASRVFRRMNDSAGCGHKNENKVMVPQEWNINLSNHGLDINRYGEHLPVPVRCQGGDGSWFVVYNGRYIVRIQYNWLCSILSELKVDVAAVDVTPRLRAFYEKTLIDAKDNLVGFRRFYDDSLQPRTIGDDWPHCLFIKTSIISKAAPDNILPLDFKLFVSHCLSNALDVRGLDVGGTALDLNTEQGLISLLGAEFQSVEGSAVPKDADIAENVKLFGDIQFGHNVHIGSNAVIAGPAILADQAVIGAASAVRSSIIGPGVALPPDCLIQNRVILDSKIVSCQAGQQDARTDTVPAYIKSFDSETNHFKTWPMFSYPGCFKRIADVIIAIMVLILFAPIILIVILVIKLASPGPIFFQHKRQGLHGKPFGCLKFRTMIVGADQMQDKIRRLNQVDGPQFMIDDDPRISTVGRFLRDTYLDEIPQFVNVLLGQMSIVGPRPSPKSENTLCPSWHDARLSVRPGVTGLWQICRTRQPMQDFQEWIYYDIQYVKKLSIIMDLNICWLTAKKMFSNFIHQF